MSKHFGPPGALETSNFCIMIDKFFDCLNVSNKHEYKTKKKEFLKPYEDLNDPRFAFIDLHLISWCILVNGKVVLIYDQKSTDAQKSAMFLSWQTYEGLQMSSFSLKSVVPFLLSNGFSYVFTEEFCQDVLFAIISDINDLWGKEETTPKFLTHGTMITLFRHSILLNQLLVMFERQQVNGILSTKPHWKNVKKKSFRKALLVLAIYTLFILWQYLNYWLKSFFR